MGQTSTSRTARGRLVGVEEEFLLVDPDTGAASSASTAVLLAADAEHDTDLTGELQLEQIETGTRPVRTAAELTAELRRTRHVAREAADAVGAALAPLATSPLPVRPSVAPSRRYRQMIDQFGLTGSEQLTCGCHVHVAVESDDEGVAVLDRIRPWLAPLLALSTNSPFWNGDDTRYASYRNQVWQRSPSAGPTTVFGSAAAYRAVEHAMIGTESILDTGMIYFDARLSRNHPTVEIRVADVCRDIDDAVLIALLCRALVTTAGRQWRSGAPPDPGTRRSAAPRIMASGPIRAARHAHRPDDRHTRTRRIRPERAGRARERRSHRHRRPHHCGRTAGDGSTARHGRGSATLHRPSHRRPASSRPRRRRRRHGPLIPRRELIPREGRRDGRSCVRLSPRSRWRQRPWRAGAAPWPDRCGG